MKILIDKEKLELRIAELTKQIDKLDSDNSCKKANLVGKKQTLLQLFKQGEEYNENEAVEFAEWMNEPLYQAPNEISVRPRCIAQAFDYKTYIIIDKTGYSILPKGTFLTIQELYKLYKNEGI